MVTTVLATPKIGSSAAFHADLLPASYAQKVRIALHSFTTGSAISFNVIDVFVRGDTGGSLGQLVSRADRPFLPHICEKEGRIAGKSHFYTSSCVEQNCAALVAHCRQKRVR